jgi:hypothetical protein
MKKQKNKNVIIKTAVGNTTLYEKRERREDSIIDTCGRVEMAEINKFPMRTQEELFAHVIAVKKEDVFGFELCEYFSYMDYKNVKPFVKESYTEKDHNEEKKDISDKADILKTMNEYMEFAWDKANSFRGLSANRSIMHYVAWIWLLGDDAFHGWIVNEYNNNYQYYGKDILAAICDRYGFKKYDDGIRENSEM